MIRVVIADDEQPARGRLASFLQDYAEIELIGEATDGEETVQRVNELNPDVLFLDIQMPKG
ncbi:MAG: response regulator, partial [Spirochaetia bacterium]